MQINLYELSAIYVERAQFEMEIFIRHHMYGSIFFWK